MGKIIHYDFRRETRRQEIQEIQDRVGSRLANFLTNPAIYTDDATREQIRKDNLRLMELEKEEREWGGRLQWEESY